MGGRAIDDRLNVLSPGHIYACLAVAVSEGVIDVLLFEK